MPVVPPPVASLRTGLTREEAARRLAEHGPNRLPKEPPRSRLALFLDQFRNLLVIVLLAAALLAGLVGDWKDTLVIAVVLVVNAVLGYAQERRAEASLAALERMLVASAKVRRDGELRVVPAEDLVVGDLVVLETGDRVPADGRLVLVRSLEIDESSLTGESTPVAKSVEPVDPDAPLGDRTDRAFTNTVVTRGRGEVEVTATGADTQIGHLAGMLAAAEPGETPLQHQLHVLGTRLAMVAGVAVTIYLGLSLLRGESLADALLSSVALAVAAIPEGLPAVVTVTLAIGVRQLALRGAIVKRLASVETLGSTTVICSDKTGTLTLNQMTVERLVPVVDGGEREVLRAGVLCNDSDWRDGQLVGDPTEGAFVRRALDAEIDVAGARAAWPRLAELPFDSANKFMATLHREVDGTRLLVVKGAPDVLAARCTTPPPADVLDELAGEGLRVLAVAVKRIADGTVHGDRVHEADVCDLELVGLVGLLDPPRPEARAAIALCRRAGIDVKMITGDHAATATAIAERLGIGGRTLTGAELDQLDDDALAAVVDEVGVFARVAPVHKVRLVEALQAKGHVVAMTGDGVNDAPALKTADIGVAMGITGTEVSKEAADVVLTDDDFSTIVRAVESGRTIFANIVTFVRFQLSTNVGAIFTMLGAIVFGLPAPFTAIQVLWVNLIMDGPPAMALGVDPPSGRAMQESPRRRGDRILTNRRLAHVAASGAVMAVGTLSVLAAVGPEVAFTTFVLFQLFHVFNARNEHGTAFSRESLRNAKLWAALVVVAVLQVVVWGRDHSAVEWALAVAVGSSILWADELRKLVVNLTRSGHPHRGSAP